MGISRSHDGDDVRWYTDGDNKGLSVTQVLELALDEDTTGLERWKERHKGEGDEFHHHHVYWYSAPRGTLCHYRALNPLAERELWGEEEAESMAQVLEGPSEADVDSWPESASTEPEEIVYSVLKNQDVVTSRDQYDALLRGDTRLVDVFESDAAYFVEAFETVLDELGIGADDVVAVERLLLNKNVGYGGQCDLVYEDPAGETVVADLKTSGSLRHKHRLQAVAYMKAVERADGLPSDVDRVEVWRMHPDSESWQVHAPYVPEHYEHLYDPERPADADYTDAYFFEDKWGDFDYDGLDDMWSTFVELVETAEERLADERDSDGGAETDSEDDDASDGD